MRLLGRVAAKLAFFALMISFSVCSSNAQQRTDLIDAPIWPHLLKGPLETIALHVNAVGDVPSGFNVRDIESECLDYLQRSLASTANINVASYTDILMTRQGASYSSTVVVEYTITIKDWRDAESDTKALLGAVQLNLELPGRIPKSAPGLYFPLELFIFPPAGQRLHEAAAEVIKSHMDRYVTTPVKQSR